MHRCAPDVLALARSAWDGCPSNGWQLAAANDSAVVARYPNPVHVNVGANKGYAAALFLALWSRRSRPGVDDATPYGVNPRVWHQKILDYAMRNGGKRRGYLTQSQNACGACMACRWPSCRRGNAADCPHSRDGGTVHMLELVAANRALLRNLTSVTRTTDLLHVHEFAASNWTHRIVAPPAYAGQETASILELDNQYAKRKNWTANLDAVALDDFFDAQQLREIFLVSIDTEGSDALVLEGMRRTLLAGRVAFLEFEVGRYKGYWRTFMPEARWLNTTIAWLHGAGYECFMEAQKRLAPLSGACWRSELSEPRWSNVLCGRVGLPARVLQREARRHYPEVEVDVREDAPPPADGGGATGAARLRRKGLAASGGQPLQAPLRPSFSES